jgi:hypothetical protein
LSHAVVSNAADAFGDARVAVHQSVQILSLQNKKTGALRLALKIGRGRTSNLMVPTSFGAPL